MSPNNLATMSTPLPLSAAGAASNKDGQEMIATAAAVSSSATASMTSSAVESSSRGDDHGSQTSTTASSHDHFMLMSIDDHDLIGRAKELRVMQHSVDLLFKDFERDDRRVIATPNDHDHDHVTSANADATSSVRTLTLIEGHSGCGKTALAMHFEQQCLARHGFFVSGKFGLQQIDEPFSGIKAALDELCKQIMSLPGDGSSDYDDCHPDNTAPSPNSTTIDQHHRPDPRRLSELAACLAAGISEQEMRILAEAIPGIRTIMECHDENRDIMSKIIPNHATTVKETTGLSSSNKPLVSQVKTAADTAVSTTKTSMPANLPKSHSSTSSVNNQRQQQDDGGLKEQSEGLKFVLKRFIQIICQFCPLTIVVDDLQWADAASLDLIQSWMIDNGNNSALLIIGCFRSNMVEEGARNAAAANSAKALGDMISFLEQCKRERCFRMVQVEVNGLREHDISELLATLLQHRHQHDAESKEEQGREEISQENRTVVHVREAGRQEQQQPQQQFHVAVDALATVMHKHTGGNPFFMQQYLRFLVQHHLLKHDLRTMTWTWDIDEIERNSSSSSITTITGLMEQKLRDSQYARYILPVAACLGGTISKTVISSVIRALSIHSNHSSFFRKIFDDPDRVVYSSETDLQIAFEKCKAAGFIVSASEQAAADRSNAQPLQEQDRQSSTISDRSASFKKQESSKDHDAMKGSRSSVNKRDERNARKRRSKVAKRNHGHYKFAHDKIQEAALALIPSEHLSELKYRVGEVLLSILTGDDMDEKVFVVSSLLNGRPDLIPSEKTNSERRKRIIAINHRAGMKAAESSSFGLALEYLQKAMALLPDDHWKTHFRLSLEIYSAAAECAFVIPDMDLMEKYCNTIIDVDCPVLHKMRGYHILMDASSVQETARDSSDPIKLGFSALSQMKCNFPKSTFGQTFKAIAGMIQLKIQSSKWNESTFRELPLVTDEYESTVMKTLDRFNVQLYFERPGLLPMGVLKSFRRTMANGVSTFSPPAFAMVALMVGFILENFKAAELLAESALDMLSRLESRVSESRTIFVVNIGTFHWMRPIRDGKGPLLQAYNSGMITGDVVSALWALFAHYEFSFICGESVDVMEQLLSTCYQESMDQQKDNMANSMLMHSQAIQNIQGISDNTVMIVGDLFDERKYAPKDGEEQSKEDGLLSLGIGGAKIFLAAHFAEYETGAELAVQLVDTLIAQLAGIVFLVLWTSYGGLSCYAAYHQLPSHRAKQRKRYLKMAKHCRKKIKHWYSLGNPNCEHIVAMLDGEELWRRGRIADAIEHYERAIRVARKNQFTHYEAYANERLGDLLYEQHKDGKKNRPKAAKERYNESMMIYAKWGGKRKVEMLRAKIEDLFGGSP
mmetsp:Transcript_17975/g.51022  ORF Transcript_17975/g.51022 Transcript_17975/m.51022 type:complete len:1365 (-) Transcript_17975:69-4163(-)